jgi:hypothetical protein
MMRWAGHVARNWEEKERRKAEGKRPLGRQRRTCVDNIIQRDLGEIGWDALASVGLA